MSRRVFVRRTMFSFRSDEQNRLSFKLRVRAVNESWLHIGTGSLKLKFSRDIVDRIAKLRESGKLTLEALEKIAEETPSAVSFDYYGCVRYGDKVVIPGSSLKGVCRSRVELLQKADARGIVGSCFIRATGPLVRSPQKGYHGWRHYAIWDNVLGEDRGRPCSATRWEYYEDILVCSTCDVLGTSGLASKVFFGNLYSENAIVEYLVLDHNEKVEAVRPNACFEGEIAFVSCSLAEVGLVAIGLNLYDEGKPVLIGKNKYKKRNVVDGPSDVKGKDIEFGVVNINPVEVRAPSRFEKVLKNIVGAEKFDTDDYGFTVLNREFTRRLIEKAVSEAVNAVPWIKDYLKFNELEILRSQGVR